MALELRPVWCLTDVLVHEMLDFGEWHTPAGKIATAYDGDDWSPGQGVHLTRSVDLKADPIEIRRQFGLRAGQSVGLAARWFCRATGTAGVHLHGPTPLALSLDSTLELDVPTDIASTVEVETCLIITTDASSLDLGMSPPGALVWSDSWSTNAGERTIQLEGSAARIPVRTVSFKEHFGEPSGALWAIDLDTSIEAEDLLANVVIVLLNKDVMARDFRGPAGEPDASTLPPSVLAAINVDLVRSVGFALQEEFEDSNSWSDLADGTVGVMMANRLIQAFGSMADAHAAMERDLPSFDRGLWNQFAPNSWKARR